MALPRQTMAVRDQAYESTKVTVKRHVRTVTATASHFVWNYEDGRTPWERTKVQIFRDWIEAEARRSMQVAEIPPPVAGA